MNFTTARQDRRRDARWIIERRRHETADNGFTKAFALQRPGRWRACGTILGEGLVQALDDVATLAQLSQTLLCILCQHPACRPGGFGQAQPLERAHPPGPDILQGIARTISFRPAINDTIRRPRLPGQHPIDPCPALGCYIGLLELCSRAELMGDEIPGTGAQARRDVVAADHEVLPIIGAAAHKDVDMGMLGVPMVDGA